MLKNLKKLFALSLVLLLVSLHSSVAFADAAAIQRMCGVGGFHCEWAVAIDAEYGTAISQSEIPSITNTYDQGSDSKTWRSGYFGTRVYLGTTVKSSLIGGVDGRMTVAGGANAAGHITLSTGNASAEVRLQNAAGSNTWTVTENGNITANAATGGAIIMPRANTPDLGILLGGGISKQATIDASSIIAQSDTAGVAQATLVQQSNDGVGGFLNLYKTRATNGAATTIVQNGDAIFGIRFRMADGVTYRTGAEITSTVDGAPGSGDSPGSLAFRTTPDGTASPANVLTLGQDKAALFTGTVRSSAAADLGWSVVNVANQACNTTCTSACVVGIDTLGTGGFLGCAVATADSCICAGAS